MTTRRRPARGSRQDGEITSGKLEVMLREAGAPEPRAWANPQAIHYLAGKLTWIRRMLAEELANPLPRTPLDRAQAAIEELRRALGEVMEMYSFDLSGDLVPDEVQQAFEQDRAAFRAQVQSMTDALIDLVPKDKHMPLEGDWANRALNAFAGYVLVVGAARPTRNGPACRFVQAALAAMGDGYKPLGTIEQALRRRMPDTNSS